MGYLVSEIWPRSFSFIMLESLRGFIGEKKTNNLNQPTNKIPPQNQTKPKLNKAKLSTRLFYSGTPLNSVLFFPVVSLPKTRSWHSFSVFSVPFILGITFYTFPRGLKASWKCIFAELTRFKKKQSFLFWASNRAMSNSSDKWIWKILLLPSDFP